MERSRGGTRRFETEIEMALSGAPKISEDYVNLMNNRDGSDDSCTAVIEAYARGRSRLNKRELERYHSALRAHAICYGLSGNRTHGMIDLFVIRMADFGGAEVIHRRAGCETSQIYASEAEKAGLTRTQSVRIQEESAYDVLDKCEDNLIGEAGS